MNYLFFLISLNVFPQSFDSIPAIEIIIPVKADKIYADHLDNLYVISENNLIKYNSKGEKLYSRFPEFGEEITVVDFQNPYKISLFFKKQNKLIRLDNNLSPINDEISFESIGIYGKVLFSNAIDGGFWLYDVDKSKLIKLTSQFITEYKTNLSFEKEQLSFKSNKSYLCFRSADNEISLYIFRSNTFEKKLKIEIKGSYNMTEHSLIYFDDHAIIIHNIVDQSKKAIQLPEKINIIDAVIGSQKVFYFDESKVYISSLKRLMKK